MELDLVLDQLKSLGQDQVLKYFNELNEEQKLELLTEVKEVDWEKLNKIYTEQVLTQTEGSKLKPASKIEDDLLEPLPEECIEGTTRCNQETLEKYRLEGLSSIKQGKVAALLLAGGQGTRLGVNYPKGMYDVGPPINKSLFQLQAERILNLTEPLDLATSGVMWYIMTSEATMDVTKEYFESKEYFGLKKTNVIFFEQNTLPCFGFDGKALLDKKHKISRSPDGNGGLYEALHKRGIMDHMIRHGIEYVHVYCVDNILVRVCDPMFMGYCISKGVDAGAKVVEKVLPEEAVGTICKVRKQFKVIEYSEISDRVAQKRDELSGKLMFRAGNICDHFFKVSFLKTIKDEKVLRYHLAIKKVPYVDSETGSSIKPDKPNGIKLEKFVFDVFEFTDKFAAWEVKREDEFSPVKNAVGSAKDNPDTARQALLRSYQLGLLSC